MNTSLAFDDIEQLAPKIGITDAPCPLCAAHHSPRGARRRVLRVWRTDEHFAGFACARCGERGGMTRFPHKSQPDYTRVPRMRGDDPEYCLPHGRKIECSPHARG